MQRLQLDFTQARAGARWLGPALLALAAAVCADAGFAYYDLSRFVKENEARLARRAAPQAGAGVSAQEVAAARETVQRLALPWDGLFAALEAAVDDSVALVAIEPDPAKGTVTVTGDGKNYLAALSYVANLSRAEGLEAVQLVRHEQKAGDPNGPVSFAVSAAWVAR